MWNREEYIKKAEKLKPELRHRRVIPVNDISGAVLKSGDSLVIDFGNHHVGYLTMKLSSAGAHQDAPAFIKVRFCESEKELGEDASKYSGWISKSWIQEEWLHIDVLPAQVDMPRRYAFRYVCIEVIDVSSRYSLVVDDVYADTVTSADDELKGAFEGSGMEKRLYEVSIRTLRNCMQDVFEDGPKRDRRLWLGDLRLQALSNSVSFRNYDLVKRCLYLFAGCADDEGRIPACLFTAPEICGDDTWMFDYSLFFIAVLADLYDATGDLDTVRDLMEPAIAQWRLSGGFFEDDLITDRDEPGWCFLDWNLELNKQAGAQFVYIYCAKRLLGLLEATGDEETAGEVRLDIDRKTLAADSAFFDGDKGLYVSGPDRQVSYATQCWAIVAGVCDGDRAGDILDSVSADKTALKMVTPYMNHVYTESLMIAGRRDEAYAHMLHYWGGMIDDGADTFYELYDPEDPDASPYGSSIVNSYCHAWSCTPVYFMCERGLRDEGIHI